MTLDYASPEQVGGGTVTTVSDVYSLGVVLYRLLTGQSPYGKRTNDAQRMAEILSDTAPTRPSQMRAADRSARDIDADLDNILLMALRKEPQARYGSVEQFANDLRNFLGGLPVQARGNAWRYRFGKFLRRRKIEIAAAAVVIASLVVGLGVAIHEARVAEQQRVIAQRHFDSVRKLANRLFVFHDEVAQLPGSTKAREMLVKTSLEYLDALYKESGTDRALQEELGVAYKKVADIQGSTISANVGDIGRRHAQLCERGCAARTAARVRSCQRPYRHDTRKNLFSADQPDYLRQRSRGCAAHHSQGRRAQRGAAVRAHRRLRAHGPAGQRVFGRGRGAGHAGAHARGEGFAGENGQRLRRLCARFIPRISAA